MSFQNLISLTGRVSQEPRLSVKGNRAALNMTLAVQRSYKNKETGNYDADFFDVVLFSTVKDGKSYAQTMAQYIDKGSLIGVTGELQNRPVSKTKDGKDFYNDSNVIIRNISLLESKAAADARRTKDHVEDTPEKAPDVAPASDVAPAPDTAPALDANFQDLVEQAPVAEPPVPMTSGMPLDISDDDFPF